MQRIIFVFLSSIDMLFYLSAKRSKCSCFLSKAECGQKPFLRPAGRSLPGLPPTLPLAGGAGGGPLAYHYFFYAVVDADDV